MYNIVYIILYSIYIYIYIYNIYIYLMFSLITKGGRLLRSYFWAGL